MKTYKVSLTPVGIGRPDRFNVLIDGKAICECRVFTKYPHCFENDWYTEAHGAIERVLLDRTGISISHAGTIGAYKVEYVSPSASII